jgi:TonB family protein
LHGRSGPRRVFFDHSTFSDKDIMRAKSLFLTLNLLLTALSAGTLHADELHDCPAPVLPIAAVRADMFGDVTLEYKGNAQGAITNIRIIKSSGFRPLDKAAVTALSRCKLALPADGAELAAPGTTVFKFARQNRVASASKPVLIADSCAPSERFTTYVAATHDRVEAPGVAIRFGVSADGVPSSPASYEHDQVLAAEAIAFIASCRFTPAMQEGVAVAGSSDGFIGVKSSAQ